MCGDEHVTRKVCAAAIVLRGERVKHCTPTRRGLGSRTHMHMHHPILPLHSCTLSSPLCPTCPNPHKRHSCDDVERAKANQQYACIYSSHACTHLLPSTLPTHSTSLLTLCHCGTNSLSQRSRVPGWCLWRRQCRVAGHAHAGWKRVSSDALWCKHRCVSLLHAVFVLWWTGGVVYIVPSLLRYNVFKQHHNPTRSCFCDVTISCRVRAKLPTSRLN
jgi:hypothetical protein